jgi:NADH-quinone oxidoreductase subunit E
VADDRDDRANATDLAMHPLAGAAALSALGLGVASQAFGLWMGAVAGSMEAAQKLFALPTPGGTAADEASLPAYKGAAAPAVRARVAVEAMVADAAMVAREAAVAVKAPVKRVVSDAAAAAEAARPTPSDKPGTPDDLKAISGIGPKLEKVLNGLGVWTYAQIAAWTPAEIAWIDQHLGFGGRIARDGWLAQAAKLAKTTN